MRVEVLGPLFVGDDSGTAYLPTAPKQRQLLALLILRANQLVSVGMCVEELWGTMPPPTAVSTVQTYILQIRRALRGMPDARRAPREIVLTRNQGYELAISNDELDVCKFRNQVASARRMLANGEYVCGTGALREALELWQGPALVDVHAGPLIAMHIAELQELRLGTLELRLETDLGLGRHADLIGELTGLVRQYPEHESLHAQLMVALYRSGRRVQSLEVFRRLRQMLVDELGIEPSSRLQRLHEAVLLGDPSLDLPSPPWRGAAMPYRPMPI